MKNTRQSSAFDASFGSLPRNNSASAAVPSDDTSLAAVPPTATASPAAASPAAVPPTATCVSPSSDTSLATATPTPQPSSSQTARHFARLEAVVARLRAPGGCPWDAEQTHQSIARNMVEEAHEAVEAIEQGDNLSLCEELGDVLLQVVFQSQIAYDNNSFTLDEVIVGITDKLIRRHPHVFGAEAATAAADRSLGTPLKAPEEQLLQATNAAAVLDLWDQIKLREKQLTAARRAAKNLSPAGLLDGVPRSLPALMQAQDISRKAVAVGFEWPNIQAVWDQVNSEIAEFNAEPANSQAALEEFGDVLFSMVNVARVSGIDAESALRAACSKFRCRWAIMEAYARAEGKTLESYRTEELEALWQRAKKVQSESEDNK